MPNCTMIFDSMMDFVADGVAHLRNMNFIDPIFDAVGGPGRYMVGARIPADVEALILATQNAYVAEHPDGVRYSPGGDCTDTGQAGAA